MYRERILNVFFRGSNVIRKACNVLFLKGYFLSVTFALVLFFVLFSRLIAKSIEVCPET